MLFSHSVFFFFKQKTAYEMRISDWSSDVCSSDLVAALGIVVLKVHQGANGTASRHLAPAAAGRANRATAGRDGRMRDCAHAGRHLHAPVTRGRVMSIPALQRPLGATRIQEKTHGRPPTCAPPATAAIAPLVDLAGRNRGPARRDRKS